MSRMPYIFVNVVNVINSRYAVKGEKSELLLPNL